MTSRLMAGLVALTLWAGGAAAQESPPAGSSEPERSTPPPQSGTDTDSQLAPEQAPPPQTGVGGSGVTTDRPAAPQTQATPPPVASSPTYTTTPTDEQKYEPKQEADMRGLTVTLGAGVEGYTQALAPALSPGPSVAVNATLRPSKVLGLELGYSGAVNEIKQEDNVSGADIVRNGGQAAVTLGLNAASVQPYVLGGIGISSYNVRDESSARFQDDTVGSVPVGAGLRTHMGNFTADARLGYNFLFDQEFARNTPTSDVGGDDVQFSKSGRYNATLNFGTTF